MIAFSQKQTCNLFICSRIMILYIIGPIRKVNELMDVLDNSNLAIEI